MTNQFAERRYPSAKVEARLSSDELAEHVQRYLESGGKIDSVAPGVSGEKPPMSKQYGRSQRKKKQKGAPKGRR